MPGPPYRDGACQHRNPAPLLGTPGSGVVRCRRSARDTPPRAAPRRSRTPCTGFGAADSLACSFSISTSRYPGTAGSTSWWAPVAEIWKGTIFSERECTWMSWPSFTRKDGTVHAGTVHHDVAVDHHLAGLLDGAGEAGVSTRASRVHLEQLDQVLTGQAGGALGLFQKLAHLRLADVVLGAQALLFLQAHRVVGVGLAARAAVLAGAVRTALHVLLGLGRQGNAEGARVAHSAAGTEVGSHEWTFLVRRHGSGLSPVLTRSWGLPRCDKVGPEPGLLHVHEES